jgi:hypothetical protein
MMENDIVTFWRRQMAKYTVRYREIFIREKILEATSYSDAYAQFRKKLDAGRLTDDRTVGLAYSIETITIGYDDDYQPKRKPDEHPPPKRTGTKGLEKRNRLSNGATDCESGANKDRISETH